MTILYIGDTRPFPSFFTPTKGDMLAHYDRTHLSSTSNIDESRTPLNYDLAAADPPLPPLDFLHKRLGEIKVLKRANVNVMCDWVITAPELLTPEELPLFFSECYKFLNDRYGKENVITAPVHMDETSPHIHYAFVPVVIDKKKGIPALCQRAYHQKRPEYIPPRSDKTYDSRFRKRYRNTQRSNSRRKQDYQTA